MITEAPLAWVIHKYWSGETSAWVVFFTEAQGLIKCFYKGARTPKKQALLQAFTPLWMAMNVRGEAFFVHRLEMTTCPLLLQGPSLLAGLYMNELLYSALKLNDPHTALHTAYSKALQSLVRASDRFGIEAALRRFEQVLLTTCGYHISFTQEAHSSKLIVPNAYYRYIPTEGFILSEQGFYGEHLLALAHDILDDGAVLGVAKKIMRVALKHALEGKEMKTRLLYK